MQSVLSRNWTRITVSISCDDNHYTTGTVSFEILLVCCLKSSLTYFSSHFCFRVIIVVFFVLFPVAVNDLSLLFLCSLRVVVSIHLECWRVLFFLLFLIHIVSLCHFRDTRPFCIVITSLFSDLFAESLQFPLQKLSRVSNEGDCSGFYTFDDISAI